MSKLCRAYFSVCATRTDFYQISLLTRLGDRFSPEQGFDALRCLGIYAKRSLELVSDLPYVQFD